MRVTRRWVRVWVLAVAVAVGLPASLRAQVVTLAKGSSTTLPIVGTIARVSIGDPSIADAVPVSPRELVVTGKSVGSTTLIVWDTNDNRRVFNVEVGVDVPGLSRQVQQLFPGERVVVSGSGNTVILSGQVSSGIVARRIGEFVRGSGATVIDNLAAPPSGQILLRVRFAEIARSAARSFDIQANVTNADALDTSAEWSIENAVGELLRVSVFNEIGAVDVLLRNLKSNGLLQILAEPNLLALDGQEASFLAGGEFPYPVVQAGTGAGTGGTVTVQFKEFGVRLRFTPVLTASGNVRLTVAPEVSQLDFGNAVQLSGFTVPALRTRRANTAVELRPGQTLAIAGLLDNSLSRNVDKFPILGDLPILGLLFRSTSYRQQRTELVVLVTPVLVQPSNTPLPVPTGEPNTWRWEPSLRDTAPRENRPAPAPPPAPRPEE